MNLQSKFGYCIITPTLNIALCLLAGRNYGRTNRQTNGRTDDPITRCPRRTFQAGGIKSCESQSQGHKVIDLDVIYKGIISGVCMPNIKYLSLMVQKVRLNVKVDNRQTVMKNTICSWSDTQSGGIKIPRILLRKKLFYELWKWLYISREKNCCLNYALKDSQAGS